MFKILMMYYIHVHVPHICIPLQMQADSEKVKPPDLESQEFVADEGPKAFNITTESM
jgi:hypothetical protein